MNKNIVVALVIVVIVLVGLNVFQFYQFTQLSGDHSDLEDDYDKLSDDYDSLEESYPRPISEVKDNPDKYAGKNITVEGYFAYVGNEAPILVSNPDYLMINTPIPEDEFLDLTGDVPEDLVNESGSFVNVGGTALIRAAEVVLRYIRHKVVQGALQPWIEIIPPIVLEPVLSPFPNKYAVLISGGYRSGSAYHRYWNDMKYMYSILINFYRYSPGNIYVVYKDGIGEDTDIPVNYSATIANVQAVFDDLGTKMDMTDKLFIYLNNHGGGFNPTLSPYNWGSIDLDGDEPEAGYREADYYDYDRGAYGMDFNGDGDTADTVKIDEVLCLYYRQLLSDDALADMLDDIAYDRMIIFMEQCFSGGFINDLSGSGRVILTACTEEQFSWAADTEGSYNEFSYHFMRAVERVDENADGYGDADVNMDYAVSMAEAFNYASQHDSQDETPHYDDNGDQVGHPESIPNGGDGPTGTTTFLW